MKTVSELHKLADSLSKKFRLELGGTCLNFVHILTKKAVDLKLDGFAIIQGFIIEPEETKLKSHTWIKTLDGDKIDRNSYQFKDGSKYSSKIYKIYSPEEYLEDKLVLDEWLRGTRKN